LTLLNAKRRNTVEITESVPELLDMALRTFLFLRTGSDIAVAARTLVVGCIGLGRHFGTFDFILPVAIQAYLRRRSAFFRVFEMAFAAGDERGIVIHGMVMAIKTRRVVPGDMFGMLKEDVAGGAAILDSDGFIGGFGGEGGVTEKTYDEENDGHAVDQLQIFP
jgi:hypothetical protein